MPDLSDLTRFFYQRQSVQCHRQLVIVSGSEVWGLSIATQIISESFSQLTDLRGLAVGNVAATLSLAKRINNCDYRDQLGQEFDYVIYNCYQGLRGNALAALSGTITKGGLMILIAPDNATWPTFVDPELEKRLSYSCAEQFEQSYFVRWLQQMSQCENVIRIDESSIQGQQQPVVQVKEAATIKVEQVISADQERAFHAIVKVALRHAKRPLVLQADRGRGKSSVLGLAAAHLTRATHKRIIITAPHQVHTARCFEHFEAAHGVPSLLKFMACDQLLQQKPEADLILVDEAAALPVEILDQISQQYRRLVFTTTVHGYEGTGRGFEIRFKRKLLKRYPDTVLVTMEQPIRWYENDSLEQFWFNVFACQSQNLDKPVQLLDIPSQKSSTSELTNIQTRLYQPEELLAQPKLLASIFKLLVDAHYQTSPDSFVSLLDSPESLLFACTSDQGALCAAIVHKEGGNVLSELANSICAGERRVNGHLLPQKLGYYAADPQLVNQPYLRVVRIATNAAYRQQALASQLVQNVISWGKENNYRLFGASFGAEPRLVRFWAKNQFHMVHLGMRKETATGEFNAIVLNSEHATEMPPEASVSGNQLRTLFTRDFCNELPFSFRSLPHELVRCLLNQLHYKYDLSDQQKNELSLFTNASRELSMTMSTLTELGKNGARYNILTNEQSTLFVQAILQRTPVEQLAEQKQVTGKKELSSLLREIAGLMLKEN